VDILQLLVSPVHRLAGRPGDGVPDLPPGELVTTAQVRAGLGLVGDRYFNQPAHRNASLTVDLLVLSAARPCAWMDATVGPGAQRALRGGGGVRCRPLTDGVLTVGPALFGVREPGPPRQ
jgi:hypothetical protein